MSVMSVVDLNPIQKAAIVVMSLGPGAQGLLKELPGSEVELLAGEILQLGTIPENIRDEVLAEFMNRMAAAQTRGESSLEKAAKVLEVRLGQDEAERAVRRIEWRNNEDLKTFVTRDPEKFAGLIADEHPQATAFLLTQMDPDLSGLVMARLPEDMQPDIAWRIATMKELSPEIASLVHQALRPVVAPAEEEEGKPVQRLEKLGGEQKAAGLLNMIPLEVQKTALENMASRDEDLATKVRKLMFVFRDLLLLDDRAMQRVLKEVDLKDLSLGLKTADEDVKGKIFKNVSERAAVTIQEEMDYMTSVKPDEVVEAQDRIIERVRALEEQGEIVIDRGGATQNAVV
ncbi:MAG: flagellar motor switch protein FliG [Candidatus Eisenbacteria sp.]|nr:flagellar motor switch protein FliG [Candidatus Eisenbacteria bacterium]